VYYVRTHANFMNLSNMCFHPTMRTQARAESECASEWEREREREKREKRE